MVTVGKATPEVTEGLRFALVCLEEAGRRIAQRLETGCVVKGRKPAGETVSVIVVAP